MGVLFAGRADRLAQARRRELVFPEGGGAAARVPGRREERKGWFNVKGVGSPGEWNFFTRSTKQLFGYRRNMHIDVAKTGAAEKSLDEFINKRSKAKGRAPWRQSSASTVVTSPTTRRGVWWVRGENGLSLI
jgi:hypothetical protein